MYFVFQIMDENLEKNDDLNDDFSPPLTGGLQREDSNRSWSLSQGKDSDQDQGRSRISKDQLFLVSLGTLISMFK
jgi:hypothetical protein